MGCKKMSEADHHTYAVVFEASSAARLGYLQPSLEFIMPSPYGSVTLLFKTKYLDEGYDALVPRRLWIDARGLAPSLYEAADCFGSMARTLVNVIAFSANAVVEVPDTVLAFDITPNIEKRAFRQIHLPEEQGIPRQGRKVDADATVAIMNALDTHVSRDTLLRSIGMYNLALAHWRPGWDIFAIAFLYMGIDSLTKITLDRYCHDHKLTKEDILKSWCIEIKQLNSGIRRRIMFKCDTECYKAAKKAIDAFEHGFLPFDKIREIAAENREKTALYLRATIMGLAGVEESAKNVLLSKPYDIPLESFELRKVVNGYIIGEQDKLTAKGQEYPYIKWLSGIKSFRENSNREYDIELDMRFEALLGDDIKFEPKSYEIYGPRRDKDRED